MKKQLEFCTEMKIHDRAASLRAAAEENAENVVNTFRHPGLAMALASSDAPRMAIVFSKKWKTGRTLRIAFLGETDPTVKEKIIRYANTWLQHINLKFDFVGGFDGDIRISTNPGGSWSYIGTDAKLIEPGQPTMNFGWLYKDTPDEEYSRVVLHEFGHALGAMHEHQHPESGIPWDREKVYAYYAEMGWNKKDVDDNIFARYGYDRLNTSRYDPKSIMHYAIPNALTIGDWKIDWNTTLSETDKQFIGRSYP
jgi:hypothetical protein